MGSKQTDYGNIARVAWIGLVVIGFFVRLLSQQSTPQDRFVQQISTPQAPVRSVNRFPLTVTGALWLMSGVGVAACLGLFAERVPRDSDFQPAPA